MLANILSSCLRFGPPAARRATSTKQQHQFLKTLFHSSHQSSCHFSTARSTIFNQRKQDDHHSEYGSTTTQLNATTNPPFVQQELSKEELTQLYKELKDYIPTLLKLDEPGSPVYEIVESFPKFLKQLEKNPEKPLPYDLLGGLAHSIKLYTNFSALHYVIEHDKYGIVENVEEMKRNSLALMLKWSFRVNILLKSIYQEWFSFEDVKKVLPPVPSQTVIEGTDIAKLDEVNYYTALIELLSTDFMNMNTPEFATREYLMCLVSLISFKLQRVDQAVHVRELLDNFLRVYPIVKQRYTTPYEGDSEKSWTDMLGRVYSESEFDWYQDLETDLPIHLGGMHRILTEIRKIYGERVEDEHVVLRVIEVIDEESKRAPDNPYIPYFKLIVTDDLSNTDRCLDILSRSTAISRHEDLKRIEAFELFKNKKPLEPKIKDFKLISQLFIKVKAQSPTTGKLSNYNFKMLMDQVEYYSRMPTGSDLIITKFINDITVNNLEEALQSYQCLAYFEDSMRPDTLFFATNWAAKAMIALGYHRECIELLEGFVKKYGAEDDKWGKLLEVAKRAIGEK